jgi:hypothetical protein
MTVPIQYDFFGGPPEFPPKAIFRNAVRIGDAAECFVRAELLWWGYDVHDSKRDLPYDLQVELGKGVRCRLQVKAQSESQNGIWNFNAKRGNWRSASGTYAYSSSDYDVFAAFAGSLKRVCFVPGVREHVRLTTSDFYREETSGLESWLRALEVCDLRAWS